MHAYGAFLAPRGAQALVLRGAGRPRPLESPPPARDYGAARACAASTCAARGPAGTSRLSDMNGFSTRK